MSKSVKRVIKNSFFQSFGALTLTGLNLVLMLGYARIYGPENFGSLMTIQAQVLVWGWLVDLGLSQSLISALTRAEGTKSEQVRQRFRARDLLFRVLTLRLAGACIGCVVILSIGMLNNHWSEQELWQRVAFCPFLFAAAFLQTAIAYASFLRQQTLAVLAQIGGVLVTVVLPLWLASRGAELGWVLLSQSVGGFLSGSVIYGFFLFESARRHRLGTTRRLDRTLRRGPWGDEAWIALAADAWPYCITFGTIVIWQRLDQIVVSSVLGYEQGGQYALAVRLTAVPIVFASAISFALFPDLQRIGRDSPQRLRLILGAVSKGVYRYGVILVALLLFTLTFALSPVVPKFRPALQLLPYFVPGVWAFWLQTSLVNALFGMREYARVVAAHLCSLAVYVPTVLLLPRWFGLQGVVWSFNIFCLSMCFFCLLAAYRAGLFYRGFTPFSPFTEEETALWRHAGFRSVTAFLPWRRT